MKRALPPIVLAAIAAFGAFVRFDRLGRPSLWLDEILDFDVATRLAHGPWWRWIVRVPSEHGPLFFASELAGRFLRAPEWSSRLAPALFGVAAIAVGWSAARALPACRAAAAPFALLLAASPFHVYFSREARPYALLMLIATAIVAVLLKPVPRRRIVAILLLLAALYTSAGSVPLLLSCAIVAAIAWLFRRERFYAEVAVAALIAAALVPLIYAQSPSETAAGDFGSRFFPELLQSFSVAALDVAHLHRAAWFFFALAVVGAVVLFRADRAVGAIVTGMAVLPVVISVAALVALRHWYSVRYVAAALPAYLLLVAVGVTALLRRELLALAGAVVLAAYGWRALRSEPFRKLAWRDVAAAIWSHAHEGDVVLTTNDWSAISLEFYLRRLPPRVRLVSAHESLARAQRIVAENAPVWIVSAGFHRNGDVPAWACRYPVVLADRLESFRLHYAPDLRDLIHNRLTAADERALAARYPAQALTMAPSDDFFLGDGWYGPERAGAEWARWSSQSSTVTLVAAAADHRIAFRALPINLPQVASLALNGVPVATVPLASDWRDYAIDVPRARWREGMNTLAFRFSRAEVPGGRDSRPLSAMFASIGAGSGEAPPPEVARYFRIDAPVWPAEREPTRFTSINDAKVAHFLGRLGIDPRRRGEATLEEFADTFAVASECLGDADFLRVAYPLLAGRPLDAYGEHDFLAHLKRDPSRSHAVRGIVKSPEVAERLH
jgi:mannosyltransferase